MGHANHGDESSTQRVLRTGVCEGVKAPKMRYISSVSVVTGVAFPCSDC